LGIVLTKSFFYVGEWNRTHFWSGFCKCLSFACEISNPYSRASHECWPAINTCNTRLLQVIINPHREEASMNDTIAISVVWAPQINIQNGQSEKSWSTKVSTVHDPHETERLSNDGRKAEFPIGGQRDRISLHQSVYTL
jgi:hypothetical protein